MGKTVRFGLDISDSSVEILGLGKRRGQPTVEWFGRKELPAGLVVRGEIRDSEGLIRVLRELVVGVFGEGHHRLQAGLSLPETQVYSKVFSLPAALDRKLAIKAAVIEAADIFPIRLGDALVATAEVAPLPGSASEDFFLAAVDRDLALSYIEVLNRVGIEPLFIESEAAALSRALVSDDGRASVVLDIGAAVTGLFVHDLGGIRLASVLPTGGDILNRALEGKLGLSSAEAERVKRQSGLLPAGDSDRAFLVLQQPMGEILQEVRETIGYYVRKTSRPVGRLTMIGGNSLIPGIVDYVASSMPEVSVSLGRPFEGIAFAGERPPLGDREILFSTAVGAGLRAAGLRSGWGIDFLLSNKRQNVGGRGLMGLIRRAGLALSNMVQKKSATAGQAKGRTAKAAKAPAKSRKRAAKPIPEETAIESMLPKEVPDVSPPPEVAVEAVPAAPDPKEELSALVRSGTVEESPAESLKLSRPEPESETPIKTYRLGSPPETAEAVDSGQGVGDIITDMETAGLDRKANIPPEAAFPEEGPEDYGEGGRVSVDSILSRVQGEEELSYAYRAEPERSGYGRLAALIALILLLAALTAGGVYMFLQKNVPDLSGQPPAEGAVEPAGAPVPSAPESVGLSVMLSVAEQPEGGRTVIVTAAAETEAEKSGSFESTGQVAVAAGRAEGTVRIVNTTARSYDFVATTRFMSEGGVLFRLKSAVRIPASGSVAAAVAADQPGAEYDIGPARFAIPGLSADLQAQIWGESDAAMTGGGGVAQAVTEADLVKARADLLEAMAGEAVAALKEMAGEGMAILPDLIVSEEGDFTAPAAGTVAAGFTASLKAKFRAVPVPEAEMVRVLAERLAAVLPEGEDPSGYEIGIPRYTVEAYDARAGLAEIRVEAPVMKAQAPSGN